MDCEPLVVAVEQSVLVSVAGVPYSCEAVHLNQQNQFAEVGRNGLALLTVVVSHS